MASISLLIGEKSEPSRSAFVSIFVGATSSLIGSVLAVTYLPCPASKYARGIGGISVT